MKKLKKYFLLFLLLFIASLNFNLFLKPLKLVTGGTQGVALIINNLFNLSPALVIFIINIIMLIISYFTLPKEVTYSSILATFIYPFFIKLTSFLSVFKFKSLIYIVLSGIISGITTGYIYKLGFSSGGLNLLAIINYKYFHIKIAITNLVLNTIIILISYISLGLIKSICSLLIVLINSYLVNRILKKA